MYIIAIYNKSGQVEYYDARFLEKEREQSRFLAAMSLIERVRFSAGYKLDLDLDGITKFDIDNIIEFLEKNNFRDECYEFFNNLRSIIERKGEKFVDLELTDYVEDRWRVKKLYYSEDDNDE